MITKHSKKKKEGKLRAVTYARVSTDEQKEKGFSLRAQEDKLRQYCADNNIELVRHYEDDCSGKTFDRPKLNQLMTFVEESKNDIDLFIVLKFDRFGRNLRGGLTTLTKLRGMGIEFRAIEQPVDGDIPESDLLEALYLVLPQIENKRRALATKAGMRRAMREGWFMQHPPKGYKRVKIGDRTMLYPDKNASLVKEAFEVVSKSSLPIAVIRKEFLRKGLKISKNQFHQMLKNPVYKGYIRIPEYENEPEIFVKGKHQAIVSEELFDKVRERLRRSSRMGEKKKFGFNPSFFLKGFLKCKRCGGKLTASTSKGHGGAYSYYHCQHGCEERFAVKKAHVDILNHLSMYKVKPEIGKLYLTILEDIFKSNETEKEVQLQSLHKELAEIEHEIAQYSRAYYVKEEMKSEIYFQLIEENDVKKSELKTKVEMVERAGSDFLKFQKAGVNLLTHLSEVFDQADPILKTEIIGSIFQDGLFYDDGQYRTSKMNEVVELLWHFQKGIDEKKTGQVSMNDNLSCMAPPTVLFSNCYLTDLKKLSKLKEFFSSSFFSSSIPNSLQQSDSLKPANLHQSLPSMTLTNKQGIGMNLILTNRFLLVMQLIALTGNTEMLLQCITRSGRGFSLLFINL